MPRFPASHALRALAVVLFCAGSAQACRGQTTLRPRPNVLLLTIDTLRADRLGCYGRRTAETPAIDGLARDGLLFQNAFTPVPLTLPAHATLLTGLEPAAHGLLDNGMVARDLGAPTLAERLTGAGYDSAAFVAAHVLNRIFGLDRGFVLYDDGPPEADESEGFFHGVADARGRVDAALEWLRRPRARPFFLWLHLFDVHAPHVAPEPFARRFPDAYDGEIAYVDSQIARLLRLLSVLGLERDTLVLLTADHGESLGEHGEETHGILLYDATLRVPLILRLPARVPRGASSARPVGLTDVAPTVLELCGLPPNPRVQGVSLLATQVAPRALWAASEYPARQYGWAPLRALRVDGLKYISAPRPELYDLARDPGEAHNLAAAQSGRLAAWQARLRATERTLTGMRSAQAPAEPDAETRERLAALGYARAAGPAPLRTGRNPIDPKDGVFEVGLVDRAYDALERADPQAALDLFRDAVARFPASPGAWTGLGLACEATGERAAAEAHLRHALTLDPTRAETLIRLAQLAAGRADGAAELLYRRRLVELFPRHAASRRALARALEKQGRHAQAEDLLREALTLDGARATRRSLCRFLIARGRNAEARAMLEELRREDAGDPALPALDRALAQAGP